MVNNLLLEQIQDLMLPKKLTRSQLLDKYLRKYEGKDVTCKAVIEAAKSIGVEVSYKQLYVDVITQYDVKKRKKSVSIHKKEPAQWRYIDDPLRLIELKTKCTYKEIAKIYNTYPHRIYEDIKHYKQNALG